MMTYPLGFRESTQQGEQYRPLDEGQVEPYLQAGQEQPTLKKIRLTETDEAVFFLLELARHMRHVELKALDRPLEARNRVDHASMSEGRSLTAGAKPSSTQLRDKEPD